MGYFLLFQIVPLALAWIVFTWLDRFAAFRRWGALAVFAAGAVTQLLLWGFSHPTLDNPDSLGYFRLGHGLETDLRAILYRPKLYPLFLGLFSSLKAATLVQCFLKLAGSFFLLRAGRLLLWRPGSAAFALFLFLFNSLWLQEPLRVMDTTLFTFLFTAYLWLAMETAAAFSFRRFGALCVAGGLASLTRQAGDLSILIVGASLIAALLIGKRAVPDALWLPVLAGILIAFSGLISNAMKYGVRERSVAVGINLYTHASFYELADPSSREWIYVEHFLPGSRKRSPRWDTDYRLDVPWPANALPHNLERAMKPYDRASILLCDREMSRRFFLWAEGKPGSYLASIGNEIMRLLWKCEESYPESLLGKVFDAPDAVRRAERGLIHQPVGLLLGLGLLALVRERRRRLLLALPLAGVCGYLLLIAAVQVGFTRYALPAIPCLLMLAGHALDRLSDRISRASPEI